METLKGIGSFLFGIVIFVGLLLGSIFVLAFGAKASEIIAPYVWGVAIILFFVNIVTLLWAVVPRARGVVGIILLLSSYVYGLASWIYGLLVTLALWGWIAIIIGLILGGVGVIPIGMLASLFHGRWDIFFTLLMLIVITYGTRMVALALSESYETRKYDEENKIIEVKAGSDNKRSWKDFE